MKGNKKRAVYTFVMALLAVLILGVTVLAIIRLCQNKRESSISEVTNRIGEAEKQGENPLEDMVENEAKIDKSKIVNEVVPQKETESEPEAEKSFQAGEAAACQGKYADVLADPERMKEERIYAKETVDDEQVVLAFAGDVCFDENYSNMYYLSQNGKDIRKCLSADLYEEITEADIFMVNNEFTYTKRGEPIPEKAYTFRSNPNNVKLLKDMGVDIVSIANNHAYDYGEISLLDTIDTMETNDMPYVGGGKNLEEARKPVYFICNDMKIGIVSATQIERLDNPDTKGATENSPGVFRCFGNQLDNLLETVKEAKANSDFVVVYIHWGTENTDELDWAQTYQAPLIAEAGADVIIGGHTHCLQGIDVVKEVPVIYSVGNFWFNSKNLDSCIVKVVIDKQGLKAFQFVPAKTESCRTSLAAGEEKLRIINYMKTLSPNISIDENGFVKW